MLEENMKAEIE